MNAVVFFLVCLLPLAIHCETGQCLNSTKTLEFLYMTSFSESINSSGNAVGMMVALDKINADSSILADYNLSYTAIVDTQCNRSRSLSQFIDYIQDPCRRFIAVIGSGCTIATKPVAEILHYWGLSQISYASNSAEFRDTNSFPQYIQMYPSEINFAPGLVGGIVHFGWKQVAIITQTESLFLTSQSYITEVLRYVNITVLESSLIPTEVEDISAVSDIFPEDGHIFFINTYEDKARQIICQAYQRGLYGRNYLWLVYGWYDKNWWRKNDEIVSRNCSIENMDTVIEGALSIQQLPVTQNVDKPVIGDMSYNQYLNEYAERRAAYMYNDVSTSHITYDATWTLALALDKADQMIKNGNLGNCANSAINDTLEEWSYTRNTTTSCLVYQALLNTSFSGLSGYVSFDGNGTRQPVPIRVSQYREGKLVLVAMSGNEELEYLDGESDNTLFPYGIPPDGTPIVTVTTYHTSLIVIVYILAIIGLAFLTVCFVFITYFRNNKIISLGTNSLNYCILLGVGMTLVSLFFRVHNSKNTNFILASCYITLWLLNLGYIISFGGILTKMGRIYYVFFYPTKQKRIELTNLHLLSIVAGLTLIMGVILFVGTALPYSRLSLYKDIDLENTPTINERGVRQTFVYYRCLKQSLGLSIWILVLLIYTAMIQISAIVLVLQTRNIKNRALNDSKPVAAIVYVISVVLVVLIIVIFAFPSYQNLSEALFSLSLVVECYSTLLLIFIPKMVYVYQNLHNADDVHVHVLKQSTQSSVELNKKGVMKVTNDEELIQSLYKQVDALETKLEKKKGLQQSITIINNNNTVTYIKAEYNAGTTHTYNDSAVTVTNNSDTDNHKETFEILVNDGPVDVDVDSGCGIGDGSAIELVDNEDTIV